METTIDWVQETHLNGQILRRTYQNKVGDIETRPKMCPVCFGVVRMHYQFCNDNNEPGWKMVKRESLNCTC